MATQSVLFYQNSDGSTAALIYDDITLLTPGVQVHVPASAASIKVNASINGSPLAPMDYAPGSDVMFSFAQPMLLAVVINVKGQQGLSTPWLDFFSASVGSA